MNAYVDKTQPDRRNSISKPESKHEGPARGSLEFVDNRPEAVAQRTLRELSSKGPQARQLNGFQNIVDRASADGIVQRERFIGDESKHHLHVEINQDHYKFGNDKGSRIELGKNGNYKLDQLIVARNYLVDNGYTSNGGQECIDWLEEECQGHKDWVEDQEFKPSWEHEDDDDNAHVKGILDQAGGRGYDRDRMENTLIQAKNETLEEAEQKLEAGNDYGPNEEGDDPTAKRFETLIEQTDLKNLLARWSGFSEGTYSPDDLEEEFKRGAKDLLHYDLREAFPIANDQPNPHMG